MAARGSTKCWSRDGKETGEGERERELRKENVEKKRLSGNPSQTRKVKLEVAIGREEVESGQGGVQPQEGEGGEGGKTT